MESQISISEILKMNNRKLSVTHQPLRVRSPIKAIKVTVKLQPRFELRCVGFETEAGLIGQDDLQHPPVAVVGNPFLVSADSVKDVVNRALGNIPPVAVVGNPCPASADTGEDVVNRAPGKIQPNNRLLSETESALKYLDSLHPLLAERELALRYLHSIDPGLSETESALKYLHSVDPGLSETESALNYLHSIDPGFILGFNSRKKVKEMITNANPVSSGISKAGLELLFDLLGVDLLNFPLICMGRSVDRTNDLEYPREDVRRSAAIELVNMEADLELKSVGLNSFIRLPVTNTSTETDVLVMAAKFMLRHKGKNMLVLYRLAANLFRTMLSKIELKSFSGGLPIRNPPPANRGSPTHNPEAGGNSGSNAVGGSGTNSTGSGPGGVSGGQGNGGEDNGDNFNVRRGPVAIVAGAGWFHLFLVILSIVVELLNLCAAWSSAQGNGVMNLFTAENALGMIIVAIITSLIMLAIYLFVNLAHRPNN